VLKKGRKKNSAIQLWCETYSNDILLVFNKEALEGLELLNPLRDGAGDARVEAGTKILHDGGDVSKGVAEEGLAGLTRGVNELCFGKKLWGGGRVSKQTRKPIKVEPGVEPDIDELATTTTTKHTQAHTHTHLQTRKLRLVDNVGSLLRLAAPERVGEEEDSDRGGGVGLEDVAGDRAEAATAFEVSCVWSWDRG
jgi:hypothetical protein